MALGIDFDKLRSELKEENRQRYSDLDEYQRPIEQTPTPTAKKKEEFVNFYDWSTYSNAYEGKGAEYIKSSNAWKKYMYSDEEKLQEAKVVSIETGIPINALLSSDENMAMGRSVQAFTKKRMALAPEGINDFDMNEVYAKFPNLKAIIENPNMSDTDVAIAMNNVDDLTVTHSAVEAFMLGLEADKANYRIGEIGMGAFLGLHELNDEDRAEIERLKKSIPEQKETPNFFDDPTVSVAGGVGGQLYHLGAGVGQGLVTATGAAVIGTAMGSPVMGGTMAVGSLAGSMAYDMFMNSAGRQYLEYSEMKDKNGKQLLTDDEARTFAALSAGAETGIEFWNYGKVMSLLGMNMKKEIMEIVAKSQGNQEMLRASVKRFIGDKVAQAVKVGGTEAIEEGTQDILADKAVHDAIVTYAPQSRERKYTGEEYAKGFLESSAEALPGIIGLGVLGGTASQIKSVRNFAKLQAMQNENFLGEMKLANGLQMLQALGQNAKQSKLFKKSPEVYEASVKGAVEKTEFKEVRIDTEFAMQDEEGAQVFNQLVEAMGLEQEEVNAILENKADLVVPTETYVATVQDNEVLNQYISFDEKGHSMARKKYFAQIAEETAKRMDIQSEAEQAEVIHTIITSTFPEEGAEQDMGAACILENPSNPYQAWKRMYADTKTAIDARLGSIVKNLKEGMSRGSHVYVSDGIGHEAKRMSDNDAWYGEFYKQHKRKPNERELLDMAREIYGGGGAKYGTAGIGYENLPDEAQADIDALDRDFETLNVLEDIKDKVSQLTASEMTVTKGLSPSGYRVYQSVREQLAQGNKDVKDSARLNAILFARYADRMAENISKITGREYTAEDYMRERMHIVADATEVDEGGLNQSAGMHAETANHKALLEAMQMKEVGANKEDIYDKTGWYLGADGKWRFEIPDSLDMIDEEKIPEFREGIPYGVSLGELYNNLALYRAYPWLENVFVVCRQTKEGVLGYADYTNNAIVVNPEIANNAEIFKETLIHEIQHFIQAYEGFASGGSPSTVKRQVDRQHWLYIEEIMAIHPKAGSYIKLLSRLEKERALNNEREVEFYGYKKTQAEKEIPPEDIKKILAVYEKMKKLQENVDSVEDDVYKYYRLHGEQEARNTSEKAKLNTNIQQFEGKELRSEDDIYKEHRAKIDPTYHKQVDEWMENRRMWEGTVNASGEEISNAYDRMTEIEEELRDVKQFAEFMQAINENADLEFALTWGELEEDRAKYKRAVLEGIDEDTAIIVFGDTLVGSYSADEVDPAEFKAQKEAVREKYQDTAEWMKAPNGEDTNLTEDQWLTVRTKAFKRWFGNWEAHWIKDKILKDDFVVIERKENKIIPEEKIKDYDDGVKGARGVLAKLIKTILPDFVLTKAIGKVKFSISSLKDDLYHSTGRMKVESLVQIDELLETATKIAERKIEGGRTSHILAKGATWRGEKYIVLMVVNEDEQGNKFYDHEMTTIKKLDATSSGIAISGKRPGKESKHQALIDILKQDIWDVNMTKELDENGEPLADEVQNYSHTENTYNQTAYHGSPHKFDTFDQTADEKSRKQKQLELLLATNPMTDDYHTGIRTVDDILDAEDVLGDGFEEIYPDFTEDMAQKAMSKGKIKIYSSKPIKAGAFVSPSKMCAEDYAGGGKVYSKTVSVNDVAWIDSSEGEYAPIKDEVYNQSVRGQTRISGASRMVSLFEKANKSTFVHEMGHVALADLKMLAEMEGAPAELVRDWNTIKEWLGVKPSQKELTREQHEQFARGFEAYLRSGEAPVRGLKSVFRKFKKWLCDIYADFVQLGGKPSVEVKAVMARMLASEQEIEAEAAMQAVESIARKKGMQFLDESTQAMYERWVNEAKEEAKEKVLKIAMKDVADNLEDGRQEIIKTMREDIENDLKQKDIFKAEALVKLSGSTDILPTIGYTEEQYNAELETYGGSLEKAVETELAKAVEEMDSYTDMQKTIEEEAQKALQTSEYKARLVAFELEAIRRKEEAERRLDKSIDKALADIEADINGEAKEGKKDSKEVKSLKQKIADLKYTYKWREAELRLINQMQEAQRKAERAEDKKQAEKELKETVEQFREETKKSKEGIRLVRDSIVGQTKSYREAARKQLASMSLAQATATATWQQKERMKGHDADKLLAKGKWEEAKKAKQEQLMFGMFAAESVKIKQDVEKKIRQMKKRSDSVAKGNVKLAVDERYFYNHLLYVFGVNSRDAIKPIEWDDETSVDAMFKRYAIANEVNFYDENGVLDVPRFILGAVRSNEVYRKEVQGARKMISPLGYRGLTKEDFDELADMLTTVYTIGKNALNLRSVIDANGNSVSLEDAAQMVADGIRQNVKIAEDKDPTGMTLKSRFEKYASRGADYFHNLIKPETFFRRNDGDKDGASMQFLYDPIKRASDRELEMKAEMTKKLADLMKNKPSDWNKKQFKLGTSTITREQLVVIALNWGTEINRMRFMDGYKVSEKEVTEVLCNLTNADWAIVDGVWSILESYWEETVAVEERVTGVGLVKQKAIPFDIKGKDGKTYRLKGGYYPIMYDPSKSTRAADLADDAQAIQQMSGNVVFGLRRGHTKKRTQESIDREIFTELVPMTKAIDDVIHNICYREAVRDVNKIMSSKEVEQALTEAYGINVYRSLQKWVRDCWALDERKDELSKIVATLRKNMTTAVMAYRVLTAFLNVLNIFPMMEYLGKTRALSAVVEAYKNPMQSYRFVTSKSVFVAERARTMDRDVREKLATKGENVIDKYAFAMLAATDQMLAVPLWKSEYQRAFREGVEKGLAPEIIEQRAIDAGDAAVRRVFGSGDMKDLSAVQRGSEMSKMLTMYYSYMNTVLNAIEYRRGRAVDAKQWGKFANAILLWIGLIAVGDAILRSIMDDDDEEWHVRFAKSLAGQVGGMFPVVREVSKVAIERIMGEKTYGIKTTSAFDGFDRIDRALQSLTSDKKDWIDKGRDVSRMVGAFAGVSDTLTDGVWTLIRFADNDFDNDIGELLKALVFDKKLKSR